MSRDGVAPADQKKINPEKLKNFMATNECSQQIPPFFEGYQKDQQGSTLRVLEKI